MDQLFLGVNVRRVPKEGGEGVALPSCPLISAQNKLGFDKRLCRGEGN